jgi:predicted RND superfamily exporter protein
LASFDDLVDHIGDPEYLLVGIEAREGDTGVFNAQTIVMIDEISQFLEDHRHITQVRSLSKYQCTHDDAGILASDDLFEDVEALSGRPELLNDARNIMPAERLALGALISEDFKHTRILARNIYLPGENIHKVEFVNDLRAFINTHGYKEQGFNVHLSGVPVIGERFETLMQNDMAKINPLMTVVTARPI